MKLSGATLEDTKQGTRYRCMNRGETGFSGFHTSGTGKPRSKQCKYCRSDLITEQGWFGAFTWTGRGFYPHGEALQLFTREADAQRYADERPQDNVVVRWTY